MPPKSRTNFQCSSCKTDSPKWSGRCAHCGEWGSVIETASGVSKAVGVRSSMAAATVTRSAQRIADISTDRARHRPTGIGELDRVLGGGTVPGGVILLAGEPGVGKSTITLDLANRVATTGLTVLVISGEENAEQIKIRADRIGANADTLLIASETDLSVVLGHIEQVNPDLLIVDSMQTIASPDVTGTAGGVTQTVEVATVLTRTAKARRMPMIIIGQVTKDGSIGGPNIIAHLVDVIAMIEGDKHSTLRMIRGIKNRYGAADEVGVFVMTEDGLEEMPDPSGLFMDQREKPVSGTCVTIVIEGRRPLPAEIQALVASSNLPIPRRGSSGLDSARLAMTQAVVERHGRIRLFDKDVFCATVGGMRITEPSADLAVALAVASAQLDIPLDGNVVALGEVALSGDLRAVPDIQRRLAEAARLGFRKALVPVGTREKIRDIPSMTLIEIANVGHALDAIRAMQ